LTNPKLTKLQTIYQPSETTAGLATGILLQLINNPQKPECLIEEIDSTFLSVNDDIMIAKLLEPPYLNAVIWESMRLMSNFQLVYNTFIEGLFMLKIG
jgi:cytochrome P450